VNSFINAEQAHFIILKDSLDFGTQEKKILLAPFEIQNGGEIQDGRQTLKCSRSVKNNADNLQLRLLED
jgi:hypothetical protein